MSSTYRITPYRKQYLLERVTGASRYVVARCRTEDEAVQRLQAIRSRETTEVRQSFQRDMYLRKGSAG